MRKLLVSSVAATLLVGVASAPALAASSTVTGAAGGAVTGAIVGGPVGAAVGGVIGAVVGTAVEPPPPQVVSYVETQPPPEPMYLQGDLAVGATLPETVVLYPVPENVYVAPDGWAYTYADINGQMVIVDPRTRVIVGIAG